MSVIFPTQPAKVKIHPIPSNANFISYSNSFGAIALKAWMPSGLANFSYTESSLYASDDDEFYLTFCESCERNCSQYFSDTYKYDFSLCRRTFFNNLRDTEQDCTVYYHGYHGEECPLGNTLDDNDEMTEVTISDTVITIFLNRRLLPSHSLKGEAVLCSGYVKDDEVYTTQILRSGNCWTNNAICWGDNRKPDNLRGMVNTYLYSSFNNDLTGLENYKNNNIRLEELKKNQNSYRKSMHDKFLCQGYDNLMMLDAHDDIQAFYTMLMAGFTPLPEFPHYMLIPMDTCTIAKNDNYYLGYKTEADSVGRHWYVSSEGFLIGQLDETYSFV